MIIINAENLILGRLASTVAKKALLGEEINIVNCKKAVITGNKKNIFETYRHMRERGKVHYGPYVPRTPDRLVKRTIRGMLPHKQEKGIKALKRIKCYIDVPENFKNKKLETIANANVSKVQSLKYVTVEDVCKAMGRTW